MIRKALLLTALIGGWMTATMAQGVQQLPAITVKTLEGENLDMSKLSNNGKPMLVDFWATWCKPCVQELNILQEHYEDWQKETGVKVVAVSIDDVRNSAKVAPFVAGKAWDFQIVLDPNSDLKRAMNVNNPPHTFLLNGKGEIVWQHVGFEPGDEEHLYELLKKLAKGESIAQ